MLFENYIEKFAKIKDIRKFMSLLCEVDTTFDKYIFNRKMLEGMLENNLWLLGQLLTWGAILYNKNTSLIKK